MCGEQFGSHVVGNIGVGSPPRVRGTGDKIRYAFTVCGITPACAGNSRVPHTGLTRTGDHPRVCGEQFALSMDPSDSSGSPPRVRGTVAAMGLQGVLAGITPACAGNSPLALKHRGFFQDHPRVCGEQS